MRRRPFALIAILLGLSAASALGQSPERGSVEFQPLSFAEDVPAPAALPAMGNPSAPVALPPVAVEAAPGMAGQATVSDVPLELRPAAKDSPVDPITDFLGYRYESGSLEWILGGNNQFGMFSVNGDHYQSPGYHTGVDTGLKFHFLNGPVQTDMPDRLFDFSIGFQHRGHFDKLSYDVAVAVMASSDFQGSAREGIRYPGHAVGYWTPSQGLDLVLGIDYLDRGDYQLLPVFGVILVPQLGASSTRDLRIEAVFPRPRLVYRLDETQQVYLAGELGGGSWAIERVSGVDELVTYHDLRVSIGFQHSVGGFGFSAIEIGYLFDRRLDYATGVGNYRPNDTAMIRLVQTF